MKRLLLLIIVVAVAAGGWFYWDASASPAPVQQTQPVVVGSVQDTVSAVGTLQARTYVDVGTQVSGQLREIRVDFGDKVEKGQLLAQLDPTVYAARVAADEASLMNLQAQMSERRVKLELAEKTLTRQRRLYSGRATSEETVDQADADVRMQKAQIQALEAQIKQAESTLAADRANLSYTKIYAPIAGTVVDISARLGQTLNANQSAPIVLRIAELDTMTVKTQVSEADVSRLKVGMKANFTTLGQPDRRRNGELRQILPTPTVTNNVVLFSSLFDVANPDQEMLPDMTAQVFFVVAEARDVPLVPMSALRPVPRDRGKYTVRVMENGQPVIRPVKIGVTNRVVAEVREGLQAGEEVVIDAPTPMGGRQGGPPMGGHFMGPPPGMARGR